MIGARRTRTGRDQSFGGVFPYVAATFANGPLGG